MATARFVVNSALRKLGVLGSGREARTSDAADTLAALQGMYGAWIIGGAFGVLRDVITAGASYTAGGGERIHRDSTVTLEVRLPELTASEWLYDFGWYRCRGYGEGVTPRDGSPVVITDVIGGQTQSWLYDGTVKRWQNVDALDLDADAPRSHADPLGLASCLAMEVADQFNGEVNPATMAAATRFKIAMTQRPAAQRQPVPGVYY